MTAPSDDHEGKFSLSEVFVSRNGVPPSALQIQTSPCVQTAIFFPSGTMNNQRKIPEMIYKLKTGLPETLLSFKEIGITERSEILDYLILLKSWNHRVTKWDMRQCFRFHQKFWIPELFKLIFFKLFSPSWVPSKTISSLLFGDQPTLKSCF